MREFDLIQRFFDRPTGQRQVRLGIGDDGAVLQVPETHELVVVTDTLVEGVHFRATDGAGDLGYKALAVNLSDLAAMGAVPVWALLNLTLPEANEHWLRQFSDGFFRLAMQHDVALVGGDTTRGPLCISVTAGGWVSVGQALTRSGAAVNDRVWITGTIGDAALGLALAEQPVANIDSEARWLLNRLHRPTPRVGIGLELYGLASAVIDISDGLASDLIHLSVQSNLGVKIYEEKLPILKSTILTANELNLNPTTCALNGGEDYELLFSVNEKDYNMLKDNDIDITSIGYFTSNKKFNLVSKEGETISLKAQGWKHF